MSNVSHLKRLSAVRSNAGVKVLTPCAFPGSHCPLHSALALAGNIRGVSSLVIGTPECVTYSRVVLQKPGRRHGELHWMYVLDAHEVVFGCRKGLLDAIRKMDRAGAKAILLIGTCVPDLIGEDIEGIVREAQQELSARLVFITLGHFKCNSFPSGSWNMLKAIGSLMEPRTVCPQVVNVMGRSPDEEHIPMPPLLSALERRGFTLRCLAPGSALEDFLEAPDAAANLVLSPFIDPLAADMEQAFGTPAFRLHSAYAPAKIHSLYAALAEKLGIQWKNEFDRERSEVLSLQEQADGRLHGLRYVGAHLGPLSALPLAAYLASLGMEPLMLHLEEFWPDDKQWSKALHAYGYDPYVCHMVNGDSDAPVLESLAPNLCLGELSGARLGFPCVPNLSDLYGLYGHERTAGLLKKLLHALKEPGERNDNGTVSI